MTPDELELFVIANQTLVWQLRDQWLEACNKADATEAMAAKARGMADYAEQKLRAVATWLQENNPEAHEDWLAELGLSPQGDDTAEGISHDT